MSAVKLSEISSASTATAFSRLHELIAIAALCFFISLLIIVLLLWWRHCSKSRAKTIALYFFIGVSILSLMIFLVFPSILNLGDEFDAKFKGMAVVDTYHVSNNSALLIRFKFKPDNSLRYLNLHGMKPNAPVYNFIRSHYFHVRSSRLVSYFFPVKSIEFSLQSSCFNSKNSKKSRSQLKRFVRQHQLTPGHRFNTTIQQQIYSSAALFYSCQGWIFVQPRCPCT